jgi:hypothetical protein
VLALTGATGALETSDGVLVDDATELGAANDTNELTVEAATAFVVVTTVATLLGAAETGVVVVVFSVPAVKSVPEVPTPSAFAVTATVVVPPMTVATIAEA